MKWVYVVQMVNGSGDSYLDTIYQDKEAADNRAKSMNDRPDIDYEFWVGRYRIYKY